jgi:hypothetical protein
MDTRHRDCTITLSTNTVVLTEDPNSQMVASLDRRRLGTKVSQEDELDPRRFR